MYVRQRMPPAILSSVEVGTTVPATPCKGKDCSSTHLSSLSHRLRHQQQGVEGGMVMATSEKNTVPAMHLRPL